MLWPWSIFLQIVIKCFFFFSLWFLLHWYFQEHLGMFSQVERTHPAITSHVARVRIKPLCIEGEGQYVSTECWLLYQVSNKAGSRCCPCGLSAWNDRVGAKPPALSLPPPWVHIPAQPKDPLGAREEHSLFSVLFFSQKFSTGRLALFTNFRSF